ncbi:hypothetical protein XMIN_391 [Xanthomonas citri pv. mangiferaeindicae LMG 941]|nr:hypothetical protein XMIN_391 [Xanthomonas citri pv. mangiferaeindicae LMG 941]
MASAGATPIPPLGVAHARSQLQPLHFARWMPLTAEQRMRKTKLVPADRAQT